MANRLQDLLSCEKAFLSPFKTSIQDLPYFVWEKALGYCAWSRTGVSKTMESHEDGALRPKTTAGLLFPLPGLQDYFTAFVQF